MFAVFNEVIPGYCYKNIQLGYRRDNFPNTNAEADKILSQVGQIMHYLCFKELDKRGVKFISCGGAGFEHGLHEHKVELMPHCIKYHLGKCFELGVNTEELYEIFAVANIVGGTIVIPHTRRAAEFWEELLKG